MKAGVGPGLMVLDTERIVWSALRDDKRHKPPFDRLGVSLCGYLLLDFLAHFLETSPDFLESCILLAEYES
jgi:hypothetical protein